MAKIIGSVGACVVCNCSDGKLTEKATRAHDLDLKEIMEAIKEAWKSEETSASTVQDTSQSLAGDSAIESMAEYSAEYSTTESESGGTSEVWVTFASPCTSGARALSYESRDTSGMQSGLEEEENSGIVPSTSG